MWRSSELTAWLSLINWQVVWPYAAIAMGVLLLLRVVYSVNQGRVRSGAIHRDHLSLDAKWLFPLAIFLSCLIYGVVRFLDLMQP